MREIGAVSVVMALWLSGCSLRSKQQAKVVTPPPPQPTAPAPQPPPQPLSIPQTQTQLPPPQPISDEALATIQSTAQPAGTQPSAPAASPGSRRPAGPVAGPKPESASAPGAAPAPQPATPPGPAATPAETETRGTFQEIIPPAELKRLQDSVAARKQEIRKVLDMADKLKLTADQKSVVARIQSFMQQSDEAEKRNEWRRADALAERAQVLAKEFSSGSQ
jgi:hypothetical protein